MKSCLISLEGWNRGNIRTVLKLQLLRWEIIHDFTDYLISLRPAWNVEKVIQINMKHGEKFFSCPGSGLQPCAYCSSDLHFPSAFAHITLLHCTWAHLQCDVWPSLLHHAVYMQVPFLPLTNDQQHRLLTASIEEPRERELTEMRKIWTWNHVHIHGKCVKIRIH